MYCSECGTQLAPTAKFCSKCGSAISKTFPPINEVVAEQTIKVSPGGLVSPRALGSKWVKCWTYFSLPVGGVIGLLFGASVMSLKMPLLGIIMISMGIFQFIVAYGLPHRKLRAWQCNWIIVLIALLSMIIPIPTSSSHGGTANLIGQFIIRLLLAVLIWWMPNRLYWKRRRVLFS